jgi:hypothetical protein
MTDFSAMHQPQTEPGIATAEDGLVILDGPSGVAVTMTPEAAAGTGRSLVSAAEAAEQQNLDRNPPA